MSSNADSFDELPSDELSNRSSDARLAAALEELEAAFKKGSSDDREAILKKYGDIADLLEPCLDGLSFLYKAVSKPVELQTDGNTPLQLDDFRIVREIGRGGMGIVYEAEQVSLRRRVALKIFPMAAILGERQLARFQNEVQAAAMLDHRHIVSVYSVGSDKGVHYYVMQLIDGQNLSEVIDELQDVESIENETSERASEFVQRLQTQRQQSSDSGPRLYFQAVARLGIEIAEALHYAHQEGIVHRDIKPANLLVDESGSIYVSDFGLARIETSPTLTMTGDVLGTLRYMSPEQAHGKQQVIDHRTDIYSLGVTLYELLALRVPFDSENREELFRQVTMHDAPSLQRLQSGNAGDLATIIHKAIEKLPGERYDTAADFADDLRRFIEGEPIAARPVSGIAKVVRWARKNPVVAILFMLIAGLAVAGPLVAVRQDRLRRRAEAFQQRAEEEVTRANRATQQEVAIREELRERLYRADMSDAYAAWDYGDVKRTLELLNRQRPISEQLDHRRFEWGMLWNLCHPEAVLLEHPGTEEDSLSPYALAISSDGQLLASGTESGLVNLWDLSTAQVKTTLVGHVERIEGLAFSPDGQQLASASYDDTLAIWDVTTGKQSHKLVGHNGDVWAVAFSPDGAVLASGSTDNTVRLWKTSNGENLSILRGHTDGVNSVLFFPDGQTLVSGGWDASVRLWDIPSGNETAQFQQPSKIHGITLSPDGSVLAVAQSFADRFRLYDASAINEEKQAMELSDSYAHSGAILSARFSPDGHLIATCSVDRTIRIWEKSSGRLLDTLRGHDSAIGAIEFLADSMHLASTGHDNTLIIWSLSDAARSKLLRGGTQRSSSGIVFTPNGRLLVRISNGSQSGVWDVESGSELRRFDASGEFVAVSPDGKLVALGLQTGDVQLQVISTGEVLKTYDGHESRICDVEFSPEGDLLASASHDGTLVIRQLSDGKVILRDTAYYGERGAVQFFPEGKTVAWGVKDNVKVVDLRTGEVMAELPAQVQSVIVLAISPNGRTLATGSWGGTISLWNCADSKPHLQAVVRGSKQHVYSLAFSSDSKVLVSGDHEGMVRFWDVETGESTGFLRGDAGEVLSLACSPNGDSLAVASNSGSLRLLRADAVERGSLQSE